MLKSELARRLFAALWFAVAAVIPVGFYFLFFPLSGGRGYQAMTVVVPIFVAGISGFALGADILDDEETKTVFQAIWRGLAIGALSYLFLFTVVLVSLTAYNSDSNDIFGLVILMAVVFLYGLFFVGWLIAIVGAAAGGLLYLFRLKTTKAI